MSDTSAKQREGRESERPLLFQAMHPMSEYPYYEFAAVDRPLTSREQAETRDCSTRAGITSGSFSNENHRGGLKGEPLEWVPV